jgi:hypothetical protein
VDVLLSVEHLPVNAGMVGYATDKSPPRALKCPSVNRKEPRQPPVERHTKRGLFGEGARFACSTSDGHYLLDVEQRSGL